MLIAGINGSPNKNGNTKFLMKSVMDELKKKGVETVIIDIMDIITEPKVPFCVVCSNPCDGRCYKGTKLEKAYEIMTKADGILFGSPVYFGSMTAQLKALFDKTRKLRTEKALYNKPGAVLTVGAAKFGGQETTIKAVHDCMLVNGMVIVGDGYIDKDAGHHGVCAVRPAEDDEFAANRIKILADRMYEMCNIMSK